ncbi:MAG: 3-phosphoshikimate 1-carboxyvinyltransferase [Micrococcaceae bacterium]
MVSQLTARWWKAPHATHKLNAAVVVPASKSLSNRYLFLASLANGTSTIHNVLNARDGQLMEQALSSLGASIEKNGSTATIVPSFKEDTVKIDCGLAGTVMRFAPLLAAFRKGDTLFDGDEQAQIRPMKTTLDSLEKLGVKVTRHNGNSLPFTVHGTGIVEGGKIEIDASSSSQFITALLLISFRCQQGLEIIHTGTNLPSLPHINMTCKTLESLGIETSFEEPARWTIKPQTLSPFEVTVEPDLSNAAPFACAAMVTGGTVEIPHWPEHSTQAGFQLPQLLQRFGGTTQYRDGTMFFTGPDQLQSPGTLDLSAVGELAPNLAALCLLAPDPSEITGIEHLRGHETDRLKALNTEFTNLGGKVSERKDSLAFTPSKLHGANFKTYHDHRMATTAAILGLKIPGIAIENIETTSKTMPDFVKLWNNMLSAKVHNE